MIFILIYINKLDTDVSWLILLIASPSNGAIVSWFIFLATLIASVAKIESVVIEGHTRELSSSRNFNR